MKSHRLLMLSLIMFTACRSASDELEFSLTPITQTGANTLSFNVDGRVFQPYGRRCFGFGGGPCLDEPLIVSYNSKRGRLQIDALLTTKSRDEDFSLDCDSVFQKGVVGAQKQHSYAPAGLGYSSNSLNYGTTNSAQTTIEITRLDTVARIISGTFTGQLQSYLQGSTNQKQSVLVTEGRFDVLYAK